MKGQSSVFVLFFILWHSAYCGDFIDVEPRQSFDMLSCSHRTNVTIIIGIEANNEFSFQEMFEMLEMIKDKKERQRLYKEALKGYSITFPSADEKLLVSLFLRSLNKLMANEDCFILNLYLISEDCFVRVKNSDELIYNIYRNDEQYDPQRLAKLLKRVYREVPAAPNVQFKQTLVFFTPYFKDEVSSVLENLRKLQDERNWAIIVCQYWSKFKPIKWLPLHRNFQNNVHKMSHSLIQQLSTNLMDVMKNPDYDRYEAAYQWVLRNDHNPGFS